MLLGEFLHSNLRCGRAYGQNPLIGQSSANVHLSFQAAFCKTNGNLFKYSECMNSQPGMRNCPRKMGWTFKKNLAEHLWSVQ